MRYCFLIILVLAMVAPSSAFIPLVHTLNPGDSIEMNITHANAGDTLILNPGTYNEHDINVTKNIIIRANTSYGGTAVNTIINGQMMGRIFNVTGAYSLAIDNLSMENGFSPTGEGGAIKGGTLTINSTRFSNCSVLNNPGGALYPGGILWVRSSTFTNCSATWGGAIFSDSPLTIISSTFVSCKAVFGGAIETSTSTTVISSVISNCTATSKGGGIYAGTGLLEVNTSSFSGCSAVGSGNAISMFIGTGNVHFSRFYDNNGDDINYIHTDTVISATNNWWGSNANPSGRVHNTTISPWLVMNVSATPSTITGSQTSTIQATLTRNSAGTDTATGGIFVPDGIPVAFTRTSGTGTLVPQAGTITAGANTTTFTPAGAGTSTIAATVDGETVSTDITVTGGTGPAGKVGVFRPSTHLFYEDYNGNGAWNGAVTDRSYNFGITGDIPITGDWNHDGITDIGVFRPSTHLFYLDFNGNGVWNGAVTDRLRNFGITGDIPITGDWNHDGTTDIGVFRPSTHLFYLDYNGNGVWNGAVTDRSYNFGITGDTPVTGDWNHDGTTDIGIFRPSTHLFYLDYNGNGVWNGAVTDRSYNFGITGDTPVTGKWT
jgi:hypothetical protein